MEIMESPKVRDDPNISNITSASYDGSPLKLEKFTTIGLSEKITTTTTGRLIVPVSADEARYDML